VAQAGVITTQAGEFFADLSSWQPASLPEHRDDLRCQAVVLDISICSPASTRRNTSAA
jgi:hypothetical protein